VTPLARMSPAGKLSVDVNGELVVAWVIEM
jgi:hypothetical protein